MLRLLKEVSVNKPLCRSCTNCAYIDFHIKANGKSTPCCNNDCDVVHYLTKWSACPEHKFYWEVIVKRVSVKNKVISFKKFVKDMVTRFLEL